jgi:hypothetical protein
MSSENRCFSFMLAALRIVRMERAVRPCFPITLPTSLAATRKRIAVHSPSSTASTVTLSGSSTKARAISATRSVMFFTGLFPAGNWVAWVIAHLLGLGVTAQRSSSIPLSRLLRDLPGSCCNERYTGRRKSRVINPGPSALQGHCISTVQYQGVYVKRCSDVLQGTYCGSYLWEP